MKKKQAGATGIGTKSKNKLVEAISWILIWDYTKKTKNSLYRHLKLLKEQNFRTLRPLTTRATMKISSGLLFLIPISLPLLIA